MQTSVDDLIVVISEIESKNILNVGCDFCDTVTIYMTILGAGIQENEGNESSSWQKYIMNMSIYGLNWPVISQKELLSRPSGIGSTANTESTDSPHMYKNIQCRSLYRTLTFKGTSIQIVTDK
jgi:hypothetical protein